MREWYHSAGNCMNTLQSMYVNVREGPTKKVKLLIILRAQTWYFINTTAWQYFISYKFVIVNTVDVLIFMMLYKH